MQIEKSEIILQFWFAFQLLLAVFRYSVIAEPPNQLLFPAVLLGSDSQNSYAKDGKMKQKIKSPKSFTLILNVSKLVLSKYF